MSSGGSDFQPFFFTGSNTSSEINSDVCPLNFTFQCGSCTALSLSSNLTAASLVDPLKTVAAESSTNFPVRNTEKSGWCSLNKRPLVSAVEDESETNGIPRKMHITEEAISTHFSTMEITTRSPPSSAFPSSSSHLPTPSFNFALNNGPKESTLMCSQPQYSSVAALACHASTENPTLSQYQDSDEESTDDTLKPKLRLPQELRKELNQLKSTGGLCDSDIQILMRPQPCLALVPYTPRIPLPGLVTKNAVPEEDKDEEDNDTMDASISPPARLASPPFLSWPSSSFSSPSGRPLSWQPNFAAKP
uniref:Uncharacterized protein n=2 Tax=Schistocephalus solidus TaxID=70667 RepID=A0A0X3PM19_SCHSO